MDSVFLMERAHNNDTILMLYCDKMNLDGTHGENLIFKLTSLAAGSATHAPNGPKCLRERVRCRKKRRIRRRWQPGRGRHRSKTVCGLIWDSLLLCRLMINLLAQQPFPNSRLEWALELDGYGVRPFMKFYRRRSRYFCKGGVRVYFRVQLSFY